MGFQREAIASHYRRIDFPLGPINKPMDEIGAFIGFELKGPSVEHEPAVPYAVGRRVEDWNSKGHAGRLGDLGRSAQYFGAVYLEGDKIASSSGNDARDDSVAGIFRVTIRELMNLPLAFGVG